LTRDEIGGLGAAFNDMAAKLQRQERLREGRNRLNEHLRGEKDLVTLADEIIACVVEVVDAQLGSAFSVC